MLVAWWNQHCENGHPTKSNLHVQNNPYQSSNGILHKEKTIVKYLWKHKRLRIIKAILSKRSNDGSITISDFKQYYITITIKTA
jgi:hypothetical protein